MDSLYMANGSTYDADVDADDDADDDARG